MGSPLLFPLLLLCSLPSSLPLPGYPKPLLRACGYRAQGFLQRLLAVGMRPRKRKLQVLGEGSPATFTKEHSLGLGRGKCRTGEGIRSGSQGPAALGRLLPVHGVYGPTPGGQAAQAGPGTAGQMLEAWSGGPQISVKCPERGPWLDLWRVNCRGQERESGRPVRKLWR